jgi:outer membrane protein assembly factor BamD (BamD/ComL family)
VDRENIKKRNNVFLCITVIILIFTLSCASLNEAQKRRYTGELFIKAEKLLTEKDFEGAVQENQKVLSLFVNGPPGDRALFNIAMIHAHYDNPARDYGKALELFRQITQEYPDSQLVEQSKTLESILTRSTQLQLIIQEKTAALDQLIRSKDTIERNDIKQAKAGLNQLILSKDAIESSNFKKALAANKKILSLSDNSQRKDKALYNIALIYAHYNNPDRSYKKTLQYFSRLIKEHPDSPYREEANVWSSVLKIIEQSKQVDIEIEQKKKEMSR